MKTIGARQVVSRTILLGLIAVLLCTAANIPPKTPWDPSDFKYDNGWTVVATQMLVNDPVLGDQKYDAIYTINTDTNERFGPFLRDELTTFDETDVPQGNDVMDVAITPDSKTALISSLNKQLIHFVDLTDPTAPVYLSSVKVDIDSADIAITAGGEFAVVTGGSIPSGMPERASATSDAALSPASIDTIFSIDIPNRAVAFNMILPRFAYDEDEDPIYGNANAVAIASDGTVILADRLNGAVHTVLIDDHGRLTYCSSYRYYINYAGETSLEPFPLTSPARNASPLASMALAPGVTAPVNVAISPDELTVLVPDSRTYVDRSLEQYTTLYNVGVYRHTGVCELEFVSAVSNLTHSVQSIAFNSSGSKAYMLGNWRYSYDVTADPAYTFLNDSLLVLDISGPGEAALNADESVDLGRITSGHLDGVDALAAYEGNLYATYPILEIDAAAFPERYVSVVNMESLELTQVEWGDTGAMNPVGLAIRPYVPYQVVLPFLFKQ